MTPRPVEDRLREEYFSLWLEIKPRETLSERLVIANSSGHKCSRSPSSACAGRRD